MIRCRLAQASIHDAAHPVSASRTRSNPPAIDVGILTSEPLPLPLADLVRRDPSSCAASPRFSASPTHAALHANVPRKPELSSPDIPVEWSRSPAHRSNSPWDFETASAVPYAPKPSQICQSVWQRCYRDHVLDNGRHFPLRSPRASAVASSLRSGVSSRSHVQFAACRVR